MKQVVVMIHLNHIHQPMMFLEWVIIGQRHQSSLKFFFSYFIIYVIFSFFSHVFPNKTLLRRLSNSMEKKLSLFSFSFLLCRSFCLDLLVLSSFFFFLFKLIMGNFAFAFLPGFVVGYAAYLWVHYMVHAFQPPKNFFKILWVHHGIHHYKDQENAFGVSSPFWDVIFGTMPKKG